LLLDDALVGVISLYAAGVDFFNEEHRRIISIVAKQIAHTFKSTVEFEKRAKPDEVTGLPSLQQLERLVDSPPAGNVPLSSRITLLVVDIVRLSDVNAQYGHATGDEALRHVVKYARSSLRVADILFRCGEDEFVALLNEADLETANAIANRIRENISVNPFEVGDETIRLSVRVTALSAMAEGKSFAEHIAAARLRVSEPMMTVH
jgi:diguanylate cyclase (GGDEF)-like protein